MISVPDGQLPGSKQDARFPVVNDIQRRVGHDSSVLQKFSPAGLRRHWPQVMCLEQSSDACESSVLKYELNLSRYTFDGNLFFENLLPDPIHTVRFV